jgi:hypothetical protein
MFEFGLDGGIDNRRPLVLFVGGQTAL